MHTTDQYHEMAMDSISVSLNARDLPGEQLALQRAAVYAELAKTATEVAVRRFEPEDILEEGAPDGYRWASYDEIIEGLTRDSVTIDESIVRQDVDHLSNAGIQIIVKVDA